MGFRFICEVLSLFILIGQNGTRVVSHTGNVHIVTWDHIRTGMLDLLFSALIRNAIAIHSASELPHTKAPTTKFEIRQALVA